MSNFDRVHLLFSVVSCYGISRSLISPDYADRFIREQIL